MAAWITVFKAIPWADLVVAAPTVVRGAQKLWSAMRKQDAPAVAGQGAAADQRALEEQVAELRRELTTASGLVANLAEQNDRLVNAVEVLRIRTRLLLVFAAVLCVALIALAIAVL